MYLLGLLDRETRRVYLELIADPHPYSILPVIYRHTFDGSLILCDSWPVYADMNTQNVEYARRNHLMITHSITFVEPKLNVTVDEFWPRARLIMRDMRNFKK